MATATGVSDPNDDGTWDTGMAWDAGVVVVGAPGASVVLVVAAAAASSSSADGGTTLTVGMNVAAVAAWRATAPPTDITAPRSRGTCRTGTNDCNVPVETFSNPYTNQLRSAGSLPASAMAFSAGSITFFCSGSLPVVKGSPPMSRVRSSKNVACWAWFWPNRRTWAAVVPDRTPRPSTL